MITLDKKIKFSSVAVYSIAVFVTSIILSTVFVDVVVNSWASITFGIAALLFVWHFGLKFPYIGLVSMERLVQFHLLLTLPLFDSILINMCAGFIMPFINKNYRLDSYFVALMRGLSNAGMNALMILSAGYILQSYLQLPLSILTGKGLLAIALVALVMQIINIILISLYHTADNKNFKKILNPTLIFADLIFVPAGVLSALLFQNQQSSMFWIFVVFVVVILVSFSGLQASKQAPSNSFLGTDYKSNYLDITSVCFAIMRRLNGLFSYDCVYLGSYNNDLKILELYIKRERKLVNCLPEGVLADISQKRILVNEVIKLEPENGKTVKTAILSSPFLNQDGNFAFICMIKKSNTTYTKADINLFQLLIQRYTMGLSYAITYKNLSEYKTTLESRVSQRTEALERANQEKSLLVEELRKQAQRDGLTGLYNRRYLDNVMDNFRRNQPNSLSLAIIDIDHFKRVNDQYGHEFGDKVLKQLAHILNKNYVHGMHIARYGGEEFVLVMENIESQVSIDFCEKLVQQISSYQWGVIAVSLNVTISIGLAHFPDCCVDELFGHADKMLYHAKSSGRNQLQYES